MHLINIEYNGKNSSVAYDLPLKAFINQLEIKGSRVVFVNNVKLLNEEVSKYIIKKGDTIHVLTLLGGG